MSIWWKPATRRRPASGHGLKSCDQHGVRLAGRFGDNPGGAFACGPGRLGLLRGVGPVDLRRGSADCHGPGPPGRPLLNAITATPGISRTGLREIAGHKVKVEEIENALAWLEAQGLAHRGECPGDGPGRKAECWWPGAEPPPGPGLNADSDQHGGAPGERRRGLKPCPCLSR